MSFRVPMTFCVTLFRKIGLIPAPRGATDPRFDQRVQRMGAREQMRQTQQGRPVLRNPHGPRAV